MLFRSHHLSGICISTAGMVDCEKGEITFSGPQIPDYAGTGLKKRMEERFGLPCEVENDVHCACLLYTSDDFKIMCRSYTDAQRYYHATIDFLK